MENLNFILISFVSFIGIFVGYFMHMHTPEERVQIERYLKLILFALYIILPLSIFLILNSELLLIVLSIALIGITIFYLKPKSSFLFPLLGIAMLVSRKDSLLIVTTSILIFIIAMITGTLVSYENEKLKRNKILCKLFNYHALFLVVILIGLMF